VSETSAEEEEVLPGYVEPKDLEGIPSDDIETFDLPDIMAGDGMNELLKLMRRARYVDGETGEVTNGLGEKIKEEED
jgi:hypothetical protein